MLNVLNGKKTYIASAASLAVAVLVKAGVLTPDVADAATAAIIATVNTGVALVLAIQAVIAIFQRVATAKSEKKADYGRIGVLFACCVFALPMLAGCSQLTTPDGDPLSPPGAVCVNTENGRVCYMPNPQPPPPVPVLLPVPEK